MSASPRPVEGREQRIAEIYDRWSEPSEPIGRSYFALYGPSPWWNQLWEERILRARGDILTLLAALEDRASSPAEPPQGGGA